MVRYRWVAAAGLAALGLYGWFGRGEEKLPKTEDLFPKHSLVVSANPTYDIVADDTVEVQKIEQNIYSGGMRRAELFVVAKEKVTDEEWVIHFDDREEKEKFDARAVNYMKENPSGAGFEIVVNWRGSVEDPVFGRSWPYSMWPEYGNPLMESQGRNKNVLGVHKGGGKYIEIHMPFNISDKSDIPDMVEPRSLPEAVAKGFAGDESVNERLRGVISNAKRLQHEAAIGEIEKAKREIDENAKKEKAAYGKAVDAIGREARDTLGSGR